MPTEILYQASANPSAGGASVAETEAEHLAASIDWDAWRSRAELRTTTSLRRTEAVLRLALGAQWVPAGGVGSERGGSRGRSPRLISPG